MLPQNEDNLFFICAKYIVMLYLKYKITRFSELITLIQKYLSSFLLHKQLPKFYISIKSYILHLLYIHIRNYYEGYENYYEN